MVLAIILANPKLKRTPADDGSAILNIAENFGKTIQGENQVGYPACFLRLQHCTLSCKWCDTLEVWRYGNPYSVEELLALWEQTGIVEDFKKGHRLILTGGSPLKQQESLTELIETFIQRFGFKPYIEIENETTLMPNPIFETYVDCWNNSPKLANSGMKTALRYKLDVLRYFQKLSQQIEIGQLSKQVWFKFVVTKEEEWEEIEKDFIKPGFVKRNQIVLMPEGQTRVELQRHYDFVVDLCCREGLRMTDRMHISLWDKRTGV